LSEDSASCAIETNDGTTRIYYQNDDGAIYERQGQGQIGDNYTRKTVMPAGKAMPGTPLAVVQWSNMDQVRRILDDLVRELVAEILTT
jgi:hypothetical protein